MPPTEGLSHHGHEMTLPLVGLISPLPIAFEDVFEGVTSRVGQFQVCVSDFFHLLNFGVCYRGKMRKIFKFFWNTPDPGTLSHLAGEQIYK